MNRLAAMQPCVRAIPASAFVAGTHRLSTNVAAGSRGGTFLSLGFSIDGIDGC